VGYDPDETTVKVKAGELHATGVYDSRRLILDVSPARIDWRLTFPESEEIPEELPTIGSFEEAAEVFVLLMQRWLQEHSPSLNRLAFGTELVKPVESHAAAYRKLGTLLPIEIDPEGSSDFLYQINRPRSSLTGIESLRINRLSRWGATKYARGVQVGTQSFDLPGLDQFACYLLLDINTTPDFPGSFQPEELSSVLTELVQLGKEIATNGDQP